MIGDSDLSRRKFLTATGGTAAAVAVAGCGNGNDEGNGNGGDSTPTEDEEMEPQSGGTLRLINGTGNGFDPVAVANTASGRVQTQMMENLLTYPDGEAAVENRLATDYSANDDFTEFSFELKEGVQFHNGDEMTADDWVYSWERLAGSPHTIRAGFILDTLGIRHETNEDDNYEPGTLAVTAEDDYTLTFETEEPFASTLEIIAYGSFAVIPENVISENLEDEGTRDNPSNAYQEFHRENPIGTGPFQFGEWNEEETARVEKFGNYHVDGLPYLDEIEWTVIEEPEAIYQTATNGNVDMFNMPDAQYDESLLNIEEEDEGRARGTYGPLQSGSESGTEVNYFRTNEASTFYIAFDMRNTEPALRKAAAYATDQPAFNDNIFKGRDEPAYALTPPPVFPGGAEEYEAFIDENYPYGRSAQISEAQRVMEEAGYGEDNRYELTINSYIGSFEDIANELADRLRSAYVDIEVVPTQFDQIIQKGTDGSLQCYTLGWIADWPAPDNFLQLLYPPNTDVAELGTSALTYVNWSETDTEAKRDAEEAYETILNNASRSDEDVQARAEATRQIEQAIWEDVPIINVAHGNGERFSYNNIHVDEYGVMGSSRQMHDTTWKEQ
jgi:peptide/nickel transport system substrate-binding protein